MKPQFSKSGSIRGLKRRVTHAADLIAPYYYRSKEAESALVAVEKYALDQIELAWTSGYLIGRGKKAL